MVSTYITSGNITNDVPLNGASNPWEYHRFTHLVKYTDILKPTETIVEETMYTTGNLPLGLTLENNIISGVIDLLDNQNIDIPKYPKEDIKLGGSNWLNNGRPIASSVDFTFNIVRDIVVNDSSLIIISTDTEPGNDGNYFISFVTTVTIKVIKNNNIDNFIFVKNYMEQGNTLKIGNKDYTINEMSDFLNDHPGPFGI